MAYSVSSFYTQSLRRGLGILVACHFVRVHVFHRVIAVTLPDGNPSALRFSVDVNLVDKGMARHQLGCEDCEKIAQSHFCGG